jgi:hypothetical protein
VRKQTGKVPVIELYEQLTKDKASRSPANQVVSICNTIISLSGTDSASQLFNQNF